MTTKVKTKAGFTLPDKKVMVVPVKRKGGWLPPNHEASFLFRDNKFTVTVPRNGRTGEYVDPLSPEEREFFEDKQKSGLHYEKGDLATSRKDKNFWKELRIKLDKNVTVFDLSVPMDYIFYKVLLVNKETIAPTPEEKFHKGTYKFCIQEVGYEDTTGSRDANDKIKAYAFLGKIENSRDKLKDVLNVYYSDKPGKGIPHNAKRDWMVSELNGIIDKDVKGFLDVAEDGDFDYKLTVRYGLACKAIIKKGTNFYLPEHDEPVAHSLGDMVEYLKDTANQENYLKIKARIEAAQ